MTSAKKIMSNVVELLIGIIAVLFGAKWLSSKYASRHSDSAEIARSARDKSKEALLEAKRILKKRGELDDRFSDEDETMSAGARRASAGATNNIGERQGGVIGGPMPTTSLRDELEL